MTCCQADVTGSRPANICLTRKHVFVPAIEIYDPAIERFALCGFC